MNFSVLKQNREKFMLIQPGGDDYEIIRDPHTLDWVVVSDDDDLVQEDWMSTYEDALKYAMKRAGILDEVEYEIAPERC